MNKLDICAMCKHRDKPVDEEPCGTCHGVFIAGASNFQYPFYKGKVMHK